MPIVKVTHQDQSKAAKPRIYFDNKNNWQDAIYIGQRCNGIPPVGSMIEADTSSKTFSDGRTTWFLNSWKLATSSPLPEVCGNGAILSGNKIVSVGWDIPTGDLSRFVSNVVGNAIAAKLIVGPGDMAPWIAAAYRSLEALRAGKPIDFDDVPPLITLPHPDPSEDQGYDIDDDSSIPF